MWDPSCRVSPWIHISLSRKSLKTPIHCSIFKCELEDSVESICHIRFWSMSFIIMISLWWYLDLFIISHFLPRSPFPILTHEVPTVLFLVEIGNIFIIHHKILILHVVFLTLTTLTITVHYICNLYCFIVSRCIIINNFLHIHFQFIPQQSILTQCHQLWCFHIHLVCFDL